MFAELAFASTPLGDHLAPPPHHPLPRPRGLRGEARGRVAHVEPLHHGGGTPCRPRARGHRGNRSSLRGRGRARARTHRPPGAQGFPRHRAHRRRSHPARDRLAPAGPCPARRGALERAPAAASSTATSSTFAMHPEEGFDPDTPARRWDAALLDYRSLPPRSSSTRRTPAFYTSEGLRGPGPPAPARRRLRHVVGRPAPRTASSSSSPPPSPLLNPTSSPSRTRSRAPSLGARSTWRVGMSQGRSGGSALGLGNSLEGR